jgi:hypothetical protein
LQGGLWLGFFARGGVAYFKDGQVRASYTSADGLGEGRVNAFQLDRDGTLWAATEGGLSRVKNGRVATLTSKNGLPCDAVHWVMEDDAHSFWLYTACGLVRIARPELDAWAADPKRMRSRSMSRFSTVPTESGAIRSTAATARVSPSPPMGNCGSCRSTASASSIPRHLPFNKLPPPVHIEQITADRKTYETSSNLRLPPLVRDLEIDYTALSLVAPEKNRFRVKLEGRDPDWKDVGNERKAFYNDLPPRNYRFRVMACNNSGVWNEAGASFDFSIDPAYYQTAWFQASCVAAFLGLLWALYRFRLHQIAQEFNARLEERVGERTRIARELHDTLLQSFQGLMLRFQVAHDELPLPGAGSQKTLESALDHGRAGNHGRPGRRAGVAFLHGRNQRPCPGDRLSGRRTGGRKPATRIAWNRLWRWKARRGTSIRSCGMKSTGLQGRRCATRSGMHRRGGSRWIWYGERQFKAARP